MSNQQTLTRRFHGAELTVPADDLFAAWLKQTIAQPAPVRSAVPRIGEVWPGQGGINGGLARDADGKPYWLIVAPADIGKFESIEWGGYEIDEPSAKSEFDGLANTIALVESSTPHPAAIQCRGVDFEGHRDYYLAAKREMAVLYANVRELFEGWHWSSTQYSADNAWGQYFGDGSQDGALKDGRGRARAVRRFDF